MVYFETLVYETSFAIQKMRVSGPEKEPLQRVAKTTVCETATAKFGPLAKKITIYERGRVVAGLSCGTDFSKYGEKHPFFVWDPRRLCWKTIRMHEHAPLKVPMVQQPTPMPLTLSSMSCYRAWWDEQGPDRVRLAGRYPDSRAPMANDLATPTVVLLKKMEWSGPRDPTMAEPPPPQVEGAPAGGGVRGNHHPHRGPDSPSRFRGHSEQPGLAPGGGSATPTTSQR